MTCLINPYKLSGPFSCLSFFVGWADFHFFPVNMACSPCELLSVRFWNAQWSRGSGFFFLGKMKCPLALHTSWYLGLICFIVTKYINLIILDPALILLELLWVSIESFPPFIWLAMALWACACCIHAHGLMTLPQQPNLSEHSCTLVNALWDQASPAAPAVANGLNVIMLQSIRLR